MRYFNNLLLFLIFICPTTSAFSANSTFKKSVGVGYFYSIGTHYNGNLITLKSIPIFLKIEQGKTSFKVSSNLSEYQRKEKKTGKTSYSNGRGNSFLSIRQLFKTEIFIPYFDINGKIKIPSNSTKKLGTSGYDFKLSSTAYYWRKKNWLTANIGYRWRGNRLRDTFSTSLGFSRKLSTKFGVGMLFDYEEAIQDISKNILEYTVYAIWKIDKRTKYSFYYIKGFDDPKIDWASGLQVSFHW